MQNPNTELYLLRHGETEWSRSGQHTGKSNIGLTAKGEREAKAIGRYMDSIEFDLILTSPLKRAYDTCRIAGYADRAEKEPNLAEWDYGKYEGLTTKEIQEDRPGWLVWKDGVIEGETVQQVGERADQAIARALTAEGKVALFSHGHLLRILAVRWLGLEPVKGQLLALDTGTVCRLGWEHGTRVMESWNVAVGDDE